MKDLFSSHAPLYATFRPTYPDALYDFIFKHLKNKNRVWDCATGNGQVARYLSEHFGSVYATDISQQQIEKAYMAENIHYSISPAEETAFDDGQFDLITVGQALHWFDRDRFYREVKRVGNAEALLAVWGYAVLSISPEIDVHLMDFYNSIVGPYWDNARKLVDDEYRSIDFPFREIQTPKFYIHVRWSLPHFAGYLETWSSTQKYIRDNHANPIPALLARIGHAWPNDEIKDVSFPVFLRLGHVH